MFVLHFHLHSPSIYVHMNSLLSHNNPVRQVVSFVFVTKIICYMRSFKVSQSIVGTGLEYRSSDPESHVLITDFFFSILCLHKDNNWGTKYKYLRETCRVGSRSSLGSQIGGQNGDSSWGLLSCSLSWTCSSRASYSGSLFLCNAQKCQGFFFFKMKMYPLPTTINVIFKKTRESKSPSSRDRCY